MPKAKSTAKVMVATHRGGLAEVEDHRFNGGHWPINLIVPTAEADDWFRCFYAECERNDWSTHGQGQMEAQENSGTITVNSKATSEPILIVVWERKRAGPLKLRARCGETMELTEARNFLERVSQGCNSGPQERIYRLGFLEYEGLPWCGEIWLDDALRLGPPSRQDETALIGPRIITVDALVQCFGTGDAGWVFAQELEELSAFLTVVMGTRVRIPAHGRVWTWSPATNESEIRYLGYTETRPSLAMPVRGAAQTVPLRPVTRPDLSSRGIDAREREQAVPADIVHLWERFCALTPELRRQFLQAAAKWQEALTLWHARRMTVSFALMVVACEALKPIGRRFDRHNIYGVIEALLGKSAAEHLRDRLFDPILHPKTHPQSVRSMHLHRGEFRAAEFVEAMMLRQSFQDPTFDSAARELGVIVPAAIIEWLRRGGAFTMPKPPRRRRAGSPARPRGRPSRRIVHRK